MSFEPDVLSPPLETVLSQIADRGYAERLRQVYRAATRAIGGLSGLDLLKYETSILEESAGLSLWEEMAPVIRDTVMDVNALLLVMRQHFPLHPSGGLDELGSRVEGAPRKASAASGAARRAAEAEQVLHETSQSLAQEITRLGERMRSPTVVSDRWNLLTDLQSFRASFREQIGNMVYNTSAAFGEVRKQDVVPYYAEELASAVAVRSTVADLSRVIGARLAKVREAEQEDVHWHAQQLEKELDTFGRTPAYRGLRAQDKRVIIEHRAEVRELVGRTGLQKNELVGAVEGFATFVFSLADVNQRDLLIEHDREQLASCGVAMERAGQLLDTDPAAAALALGEALESVQALYGRASSFDTFLRKARKQPPSASDAEGIRATLDALQGFLAELMLG